MTDQAKHRRLNARDVRKRRIDLSMLAEYSVILAGAFLTLTAFMFTNAFVENIIKNEYAMASENAAAEIAKKFSDTERALNAVAIILAHDPNNASLLDEIKRQDAIISSFDQIVVYTPLDGGKWGSQILSKRQPEGSKNPVYSIKPDNQFLAYVINNGFLKDNDLHAVLEPGFFNAQDDYKPSLGDFATPIGLTRVFNKDANEKHIIVGIGQAANILSDPWMARHENIRQMTIRDPQTGFNLFHLERDSGSVDRMTTSSQVYEFKFAGRQWEVSSQYTKEGKIYLLQAIPFLALLFGLILTAAGGFYHRGARRHSLRVTAANDALRAKNKELQAEGAKREQLDAMLKRSERENKSVIDSVNDIIFETDTCGHILFLNATWRKITGFDQEQSLGLDFISLLHPQDQEKQRKDFELLVKGQKQNYRSFARLRTEGGTFRAVEISISMIRQDENKNLRVVGAMTDVEEHRRAERALAEAEKKYRTIVENAAGGIFQLTPQGIYLSVNPAFARILGYQDSDELLRMVKNANDTVYFNQRERQYFLKELESAGSISNYETQVVRKDGKRLWVNENARVVRDESGATLYYEGAMEDISQRKEAEMGLREAKIHSDLANRAKSEFLANMSHELRTPLNAIIGFSEILKNEIFGPLGQESYKEYVRDIHDSGRKLLTVINEILDISKIEAGDRYLNEQIVDLYAITEASLKMLDNKIKANNLVVTNMLKDVPRIVGEELALKQIMINILSNAIKFTPAGGRVMVSNETDANGALRFSITDTGIGLDESEIEKALSPFGQVNSDLSRAGSGTGLGLTLVDALVRLHEGKLELFSQKGIGTTVTIVFPKDRVAQPKQAASSTESQKIK